MGASMTGRLAGKVALITGAGHGQGRSHALRLAQEGADIIDIDACAPISKHVLYPMADDADLAETARRVEEFDRRVVAAKADVRDIAQMQAAVAQGLAEFGHIDIVVANAGIFGFHNCWEIPDDAWDDMIDTNLKGPLNTIKAVVPSMIETVPSSATSMPCGSVTPVNASSETSPSMSMRKTLWATGSVAYTAPVPSTPNASIAVAPGSSTPPWRPDASIVDTRLPSAMKRVPSGPRARPAGASRASGSTVRLPSGSIRLTSFADGPAM